MVQRHGISLIWKSEDLAHAALAKHRRARTNSTQRIHAKTEARLDQEHDGSLRFGSGSHAAGRTMATRPPLPPFTRETAIQKRSEEHTSELQSRGHLVCRLLLE